MTRAFLLGLIVCMIIMWLVVSHDWARSCFDGLKKWFKEFDDKKGED